MLLNILYTYQLSSCHFQFISHIMFIAHAQTSQMNTPFLIFFSLISPMEGFGMSHILKNMAFSILMFGWPSAIWHDRPVIRKLGLIMTYGYEAECIMYLV